MTCGSSMRRRLDGQTNSDLTILYIKITLQPKKGSPCLLTTHQNALLAFYLAYGESRQSPAGQ